MSPTVSLQSSSLEWLHSTQGRGIQPGLQRMERLLAALGNPEKKLRCLHVAGTNGKGSVCAIAESILRAEGYGTGLYTSPHLVNFAERIQMNGQPVGAEKLEAGIQRLQQVTQGWSDEEKPTFFELVSALAFDLFARAECEVVVLETGLGGRLDATNTAPKLACAITPIALDHQEWLGESLTEIAREKAGIFRAGVPVVMVPQEGEAAEALVAAAEKVGAPWEEINEPLNDTLELGLVGSHQRWNGSLALALMRAGGFSPSEEGIRKGLAAVSWPGRFQRLREGRLILDGAHNLHAVERLVTTWKEEYGDQKCCLIFGALADKNPQAMLAVLEEISAEIILVPVNSPRSMDPKHLLETLPKSHSALYHVVGSLKQALKVFLPENYPPLIKKEAKSLDHQRPVLLTGSLFLVGEALALESGEEMLPYSQ